MTCHQMVSTRSVSAGKWFQKVSSSASEGSALAPLVTSLGWSALPFPSWWQPAPPREGRHSVNGIFFFFNFHFMGPSLFSQFPGTLSGARILGFHEQIHVLLTHFLCICICIAFFHPPSCYPKSLHHTLSFHMRVALVPFCLVCVPLPWQSFHDL